jgi:hypothetical protein
MRTRLTVLLALAALLFGATTLSAQDRRITLAADAPLIESGFLNHLLPRFSLKTQIRTEVVALARAGEADVLLGPAEQMEGAQPALAEGAVIYAVRSTHTNADAAAATYADRFIKWLLSDIGQRTVAGFGPEGAPRFTGAANARAEVEAPVFDGNAQVGAGLSLSLCGRCHVVGPKNRMKGLGSTPSFGMLRNLRDWEDRFRAFYMLNPHPAFTQVAEVTEPFHETQPSPIAPVEMTLDQLEAILAYVAAMQPADLGAPVKHQ